MISISTKLRDRSMIASRFILMIVFFIIFDQWVDEMLIFYFNFIVYVYWHDIKNLINNENRRYVKNLLTKNHVICRENLLVNERIIVVITFQIQLDRHEIFAQSNWLSTKMKKTQKNIDVDRFDFDSRFSYEMINIFQPVVINEAHLIRNSKTYISISLSWLKVSFHVCISITSLFNNAWDFNEFLKMIESINAWLENKMIEWIIDENENSFELFFNYLVISLQIIVKKFDKYIIANEINCVDKNIRMSQIWKQWLLRKSIASYIFFVNERQIANDMFSFITSQMMCKFIEKKKYFYNVLIVFLQKKLNKKLNNEKIVWNLNVLKKLILYNTWFDFKYVQQHIKHDMIAR